MGSNNLAIDPSDSTALLFDQRGSARIVGGTIDIGAFEVNIDIAPATLPNTVGGAAYSQQLTASRDGGGSGAFTYSIISGSLPAGLTLSANGLLSGTSTASGTFTFIVKATAADGIAGVRQYTITVGCAFTVNPLSQSFANTGGTGTINVTASAAGCSYTTQSNASWITVNTSGGATVTFTVAANTGAERTGTITVAGQTFTVTQASGCTFALTPGSANIPGNASTGSFNVASGAGCAYTAVSNDSFVTITSGASGSGNGAVAYSVAVNTTGVNRTGTITVGGQTFTVTQAALPTLTINSQTLNEGNNGTTAFNFTVSLSAAFAQSVTVNYATANGTATAGEDYTAANGTLTFAPGEVNKTLTVQVVGDTVVEGNETFTVGLSNVSNATIAVGQGVGTILNDDGGCTYSISPASLNTNSPESAGNTITVTTQAGCAYTAVSNDSFITINSGANGSGNGTVSFTVSANTGAARTGTITVAGQTFTVNQSTVSVAVNAVRFDYDGDKKADISVYRPSNGSWYIQNSLTGFQAVQFGLPTDRMVPADYDGDGKTDVAVWRENPVNPDRASFFILNSRDGTLREEQFGRTGDSPLAVGDWDGDGRADPAVYRAGAGNGQSFFFYKPSTRPNVDFVSASWGIGEDKPVIADYDGDGRVDVGVFRPSNGIWYIAKSGGGFSFVQFGSGEDKAVPADYDGDGKSDIAVYRPSNGTWYILQSGQGFTSAQFGIATDLPAPADYDGDGKTDIAVFRSENGTLYQQRTTLGFGAAQFGAAGDRPTPNAFVP